MYYDKLGGAELRERSFSTSGYVIIVDGRFVRLKNEALVFVVMVCRWTSKATIFS